MARHGCSAGANLLSATARLLQETDTADITLACGGKEWRLHSLILSMRSPFFKAALSTDMLEKQEKKISIEELDPKVMQQVIDYMHGVSIETETIHCFPKIMEAAKRFLMDDLIKYVTQIAIRSITVENAVELGKLAEDHSMDEVLEACAEYIVEHDVKIEEELNPKFANTMIRLLQKAIEKKSGNMNKKVKGKTGVCPMCLKVYWMSQLAKHASECSGNVQGTGTKELCPECLELIPAEAFRDHYIRCNSD